MPELVPVMWTPWLIVRLVMMVFLLGLLVRATYVRWTSLQQHLARGRGGIGLMIRQDRMARVIGKWVQYVGFIGLLYARFFTSDPISRVMVGDFWIAVATLGLLIVLVTDWYFMRCMEAEDRAHTRDTANRLT